jgi:hypothetical protein
MVASPAFHGAARILWLQVDPVNMPATANSNQSWIVAKKAGQ